MQLQLDLEAVCARRASQTAAIQRMDFCHCFDHASNRLDAMRQSHIAAFAKARQPVFGERLAGAGFNQGALVLDGLANEESHAFGKRELPAEFFEHVSQHPIGDGLAVDQHAVTVEQHGIKFRDQHVFLLANK